LPAGANLINALRALPGVLKVKGKNQTKKKLSITSPLPPLPAEANVMNALRALPGVLKVKRKKDKEKNIFGQ